MRVKTPNYSPNENPPCDRCIYSVLCERECLVYNHWVRSGKILENIFQILNK